MSPRLQAWRKGQVCLWLCGLAHLAPLQCFLGAVQFSVSRLYCLLEAPGELPDPDTEEVISGPSSKENAL